MSSSKVRQNNAGQGFTLLEVMVALAIIAIVLVSVLRMQGQTISMNEAFRFYTIAPQLATSKMAEFRRDPEAMELDNSGDFGEAYSGYNWQATVEEIVVETEEDREMKLKQVNITVTYLEDEYSYAIREYMAAEPDEL